MEIIKKLSNQAKNWFDKYGIISLITIILVPLKLLYFYDSIEVSSYFFAIVGTTTSLVILLFLSFKNKLVPSVIYVILSILMFADTLYYSFFRDVLSVNLLQSTSMLGDVSESLKQIVKFEYVIVLLDALFIAFLPLNLKLIKKVKIEATKDLNAEENETEKIYIEEAENQVELGDDVLRDKTDTETDKPDASLELIEVLFNRYNAAKLAMILIITIIVMIGEDSEFTLSLKNQEFFAYHISDIYENYFAPEEEKEDIEFTDSYMEEKLGDDFGIAKGKNLVVIQLESFQSFVLNYEYNGVEVTPFLNSLLKEDSAYFANYFQQIGKGNTSDAEFAINNSLMGYPESFTYSIFEDNTFRGLPVLLKEEGYHSTVMHANDNRDFWNRENAYESMGFDTYYAGIDESQEYHYESTEWMGWGLTDLEFFRQSIGFIEELPQPFYNFMITLTHHHPFILDDSFKQFDLKEEDEDTLIGNYLISIGYADYALSEFFDMYKELGLYEDTIFAIYGDHRGLSFGDEIEKEFLDIIGYELDWYTQMNVPMIFHVPGAGEEFTRTYEVAGGHMDFLPTITYLMGFDTLDTFYLGNNLFSIDENIVIQESYLEIGSFFTEEIVYEASKDEIFTNGKAYNYKTKEYVNVEDYYEDYLKGIEISEASKFALENDLLKQIYVDGKTIEEALNGETISTWNNPFIDIDKEDWFFDSVEFVITEKIMGGITDTEFGPNETLSANETMVMLGNFDKSIENSGDEDLSVDQYLSLDVEKEIQDSFESLFGDIESNIKLTRQEFALLVYEYASSKIDTEKYKSEEELVYVDLGEVDNYVKEAIDYLIETEIISDLSMNYEGKIFYNAEEEITRADAVSVFKNLSEFLK